jgi:hypothetical protein
MSDLALQSRLHSMYESQIPMMGGAMAGGRRKRRRSYGGAMTAEETSKLIERQKDLLDFGDTLKERAKERKMLNRLKKLEGKEKSLAKRSFDEKQRNERKMFMRAYKGHKFEEEKARFKNRFLDQAGEYAAFTPKEYLKQYYLSQGLTAAQAKDLAAAETALELKRGQERAARRGYTLTATGEAKTLPTGLGLRRKRRSHSVGGNPWIRHVKAYWHKHPRLSYAQAMKAAKSSYRGSALVGGEGGAYAGGRRRRTKKRSRSVGSKSRRHDVLRMLLSGGMRKKKRRSVY